MDLNGTSSIVTGGASGIGLACAKRLASHGVRVVVLDMNEAKGNAVAKELGGDFAKADVADEAQVQAAVDAAVRLGPLRSLVNAAGIGHAMRTVDREGKPFDLAAFERVLRINLVGTFNCIRLAASAMSKTAPFDADGEPRRDREHRVGGGLRRPDRPGGLLCIEGGRGRADTPRRPRPLGDRRARQYGRPRSRRHADLWLGRGGRRNSRRISGGTCCFRSASARATRSPAWCSS